MEIHLDSFFKTSTRDNFLSITGKREWTVHKYFYLCDPFKIAALGSDWEKLVQTHGTVSNRYLLSAGW